MSASFHTIKQSIESGEIEKASKDQLQQYAILLSRSQAYGAFGASSYPQVCETVRTLLIVRMSQDANQEATRISKIAMGVAMAAAGFSLLQLILSIWPE